MKFLFDYVQVSVESISGETSPKTINVKIHVGNENGKARSDNIFDDPIYISIPEDTPVGTHIHDIQPISESKTGAIPCSTELFCSVEPDGRR